MAGYRGVIFILGIIVFETFLVSAIHSDVSAFEVNIIGPPEPIVKIRVPDNVFFGDLENGKQSDEIRINITNTGTVGVVIIPQLIDQSEKIFNFAYFARRTTNPFQRIGIFNFNITAPATGDIREDYIYAKLDLRDFDGIIDKDIPGHKADVRFFAVAV
jgi:hypothetical protein